MQSNTPIITSNSATIQVPRTATVAQALDVVGQAVSNQGVAWPKTTTIINGSTALGAASIVGALPHGTLIYLAPGASISCEVMTPPAAPMMPSRTLPPAAPMTAGAAWPWSSGPRRREFDVEGAHVTVFSR
jgi:hypothetical protein